MDARAEGGAPALECRDRRGRRAQLRAAGFNGIDFVEIDDEGAVDENGALLPPVLCVHFFGEIPEGLTTANVRIEGGRRIRDIQVTAVEARRSTDPEMDDCLRVTLDRAGDLTTYRLCFVDAEGAPLAKIDPRYRCASFVFRVDCLDCPSATACEPDDTGPPPEINYLAKDYGSFRQLLLDRLAVLVPDWKERHAADLGVALLELLAYVGDQLSYFQDAVATEAYLDTARQRISVRRHARLVDYAMHEGCNARAFLSLTTDSNVNLPAADVFFATAIDPPGCAGGGGVYTLAELEKIQAKPGAIGYETFEAILADGQTTITVRAAHSEIELYTWGDDECCLPRGATRATLTDDVDPAADGQRRLALAEGDLVLFEEVLGPETGDPADADPQHRHVVRLTSVVQSVDPVTGQPIVEIAWDACDALPFTLCLSVRLGPPSCERLGRVVVARGNVVLVDHGATVTPDEPLGEVGTATTTGACSCDGALVELTKTPAPFRPTLGNGLTFCVPMPAPAPPAAALLVQDPRRALPAVTLHGAAGAAPWTPRPDLLDSGPDDNHFVVEMDDRRLAHLRFGDGTLGRQPPAGAKLAAHYRVGNGPAGNVGRDTIVSIVLRTTTLTGVVLRARNPLAATGGTAPEPVEEVKQLAPGAFRRVLLRAISADDYAALAAAPNGEPSAALQGAVAELEWTGSWYEAHVAVDPTGRETASPRLLAAVEASLVPYRRIGHDLRVAGARYVPLDIGLELCVLPDYVRSDVVAAVVEAFSAKKLPGGKLGLFHPDNLRFNQGVFLSRVVAAAQAVPGVRSVTNVSTFKRLFEPAAHELDDGVIALGFSEIPQLDNDRNQPENGRLTIVAGGGR